MEQSCSKQTVPSRPPALPPSLSRYQYAQFSQSSSPVVRPIQPQQVPAVLNNPDGSTYRRNDPANRTYRMRKRPPAQVYHCVQCNKHIKYPSKISEHIRKHTGEKPHICHICGHCFSQAHTLKTHLQQHVHEKPYKCSYCTAVFLNSCDKTEHEAQHIHHTNHSSESLDDDCPPFLQVGGAPEEPLEHTEQVFYACPLSCGFQNPVEAVVVEHFQLDHDHEHNRYENVCWEEQAETAETGQHTDGKLPIEDISEEMIVPAYNEEPDQMFEYYDHEFVAQDAPEEIAGPSEAVPEEPCSSSSYGNHFEAREESDGMRIHPPGKYEIIFAEEEERRVDEDLIEKKGIGNIEQDIKPVIPEHIYEGIILEEIGPDADEVGLVNDEEEEQERVRVIVNPNPPKRGTKSLRDHHEATAAMTEMVVDAATLEMAAPMRHLKRGTGFGYLRELRKKKQPKNAQNLDWIIDAVAKGVDVNDASPHQRKKPTLHKCEFCGKVDKYPSKIRAHMRTHTGEKPFKCDICGMAFSQRTPLRLHLRRHLDQKPYECDVVGCKERFVSGAILKMHYEKKHLNKKKYVCSRGCGRVFSSAFNQRHHEKKCSQNNYLTWVEEAESGEETVGEYPDEDEEYMDEMMDPSTSEPQTVDQHFVEEPVFLHP